MKPSDVLREGVALLDPVLGPHGFQFQFGGEGTGSGGAYAWGEYVRSDRRLELHFRYSLGWVTYHLGALQLNHSAYVAALGVSDRAQYPGIPEDPLSGFRHLAHDLATLLSEFTLGDAAVLRAAAEREAAAEPARQRQYMAWAAGDTEKRGEARRCFHAGDYEGARQLLESLQYPELATETEQQMLRLARARAGSRARAT